MDDPKKLTVRSLRELARKHFVKGYSRLRKEQLLAALKKIPGAFRAAVARASKSPSAPPVDRAALKAPAQQSSARAPRTAPAQPKAKKAAAKTPAPPSRDDVAVDARNETPKALVASVATPAEVKPATVVAEEAAVPAPAADAAPAEPKRARMLTSRFANTRREARPTTAITDGFFVARAPESRAFAAPLRAEANRPATDSTAAFGEDLGELPRAYREDSLVAVARDPRTLFVFWSFDPASIREKGRGLLTPQPIVRVMRESDVVREEPLALDSGGHYLRSLEVGHTYRVEVVLRGSDGRIQILGAAAPVTLPRAGPSENTEVRFLHVPPGLPTPQVARLVEQSRPARPLANAARFITWERIALPSSGELIKVNDRATSAEGELSAQERRGFSPSGRSGRVLRS